MVSKLKYSKVENTKKEQQCAIYDVMYGFIDVNIELPKKSQEVEIIVNGNICKCMYYHEKSDMFPNGFFGTYYKMVIDNVTHWRNCA